MVFSEGYDKEGRAVTLKNDKYIGVLSISEDDYIGIVRLIVAPCAFDVNIVDNHGTVIFQLPTFGGREYVRISKGGKEVIRCYCSDVAAVQRELSVFGDVAVEIIPRPEP